MKENKKEYETIEIRLAYFLQADVIRTSYVNDGNNGDWEDENAQPNPLGIF